MTDPTKMTVDQWQQKHIHKTSSVGKSEFARDHYLKNLAIARVNQAMQKLLHPNPLDRALRLKSLMASTALTSSWGMLFILMQGGRG